MPNRSGFVSILGRPNAGKSTLLNALIGTKIAIVADKPQTTRTVIQGVLAMPGAQIVFLDTPGIHKSDSLINRRMMQAVRTALEDRDLLLFLVDATVPFSEEDEHAAAVLKKANCPVLLVLNKIDRLKRQEDLLPLIETYRAVHPFEEYLPVSALTGTGLDRLKQAILERMPDGPLFYPPDYITDQPERFVAAETIREKVLHQTRQEVPHAVAVLIDTWEEKKNLLRVGASIYVEREGQKGIIIGSKGSMLKTIGSEARLDLEAFFGRKVFLELFVKVRPGWRESPEFLNALDWRAVSGVEE
jgi:GTP-binding protein Era